MPAVAEQVCHRRPPRLWGSRSPQLKRPLQRFRSFCCSADPPRQSKRPPSGLVLALRNILGITDLKEDFNKRSTDVDNNLKEINKRLSSLETEKGTTTEVALSRVLGLQHTGGYEQASELASPVDLLHLVGRFQGAEEANNWVYQHTRTLVQWLTQPELLVRAVRCFSMGLRRHCSEDFAAAGSAADACATTWQSRPSPATLAALAAAIDDLEIHFRRTTKLEEGSWVMVRAGDSFHRFRSHLAALAAGTELACLSSRTTSLGIGLLTAQQKNFRAVLEIDCRGTAELRPDGRTVKITIGEIKSSRKGIHSARAQLRLRLFVAKQALEAIGYAAELKGTVYVPKQLYKTPLPGPYSNGCLIDVQQLPLRELAKDREWHWF